MIGATMHADRHARLRQHLDRAQPMRGPARARFHLRGEIRIERRDGNEDMHRVEGREFLQHVDVARDQKILRDERDRIAEFRQHLQARARDAELPLGRLIAIGHAAHAQHLRLILWAGKVPGAAIPPRGA